MANAQRFGKHVLRPATAYICTTRRVAVPLHRQPLPSFLPPLVTRRRFQTTAAAATAAPSPASPKPEGSKKYVPAPHRNAEEPIYQLTFTCKACEHRSAHTVSKQGYHKGTVLITCPGCKNRHLISDNLKIFRDQAVTLEQILAEKGEGVKRGSVDMEGDIEFWEAAEGQRLDEGHQLEEGNRTR